MILPEIEVEPSGDPMASALEHRHDIERMVETAGAVRVRGLSGLDVAGFAELATRLCGPLMTYHGDTDSGRVELAPNVYTPTGGSPAVPIPLHSERSIDPVFPARLAFYCQRPPSREGATTIASTRALAHDAPTGFADEEAWVRHWVHAGPETAIDASRLLKQRGLGRADELDATWDCDGECLRRGHIVHDDQRISLWTDLPSVRVRSDGQRIWWNQCTVFALSDRFRARLPKSPLPVGWHHDATRPDGSRFSDDLLRSLRRSQRAAACAPTWRTGDLLLLDNRRVAHGRDAYEGERTLWTALGTALDTNTAFG